MATDPGSHQVPRPPQTGPSTAPPPPAFADSSAAGAVTLALVPSPLTARLAQQQRPVRARHQHSGIGAHQRVLLAASNQHHLRHEKRPQLITDGASPPSASAVVSARSIAVGGSVPRPLSRAALSWEAEYKLEQQQRRDGVELAKALFTELVARNPNEALRPSPLRTALSAALLEQLVAVFPRYQGVLNLVSRILVQAVYVPDAEPYRSLLRTLHLPLTLPLDGLNASTTAAATALLEPYSRKTFAAAHEQLNAELRDYIVKNRRVEVRLSRQVRVFDITLGHWVKSLKRSFFVAWRNFTSRRRQLRKKYRAIFYRLRSDECKIKAIRRWRERAAQLKKAALVDAASNNELHLLGVSTEHIQQEISQLKEHNANLSRQITVVETERSKLTKELSDKEQLVVSMARRCTEIETTGNDLLDAVLPRYPPPLQFSSDPLDALVVWGHAAVKHCGGAPSGDHAPFAPLVSDEDDTLGVASVAAPPWDAFGCVLAALVPERAPPRAMLIHWHLHPNDAPAQLVVAFQTVTGRQSLVSVEQLQTKHRGVLLMLLASMLRVASQWTVCKPMRFGCPGCPAITPGAVLAGGATPKPTASAAAAASSSPHLAAPGETWKARVTAQQQWSLFALAAVNHALNLAVIRPPAMSPDEMLEMAAFVGSFNVDAIGAAIAKATNVVVAKGKTAQFLSTDDSGAASTRPKSPMVDPAIAATLSRPYLQVLRRLYLDLRRVYQAYAVPTLTATEVVRLLRDCKLLAPPQSVAPTSSPTTQPQGNHIGAISTTTLTNGTTVEIGKLTKSKLESILNAVQLSTASVGSPSVDDTSASTASPIASAKPPLTRKPSATPNPRRSQPTSDDPAPANGSADLSPGQFSEMVLRVCLAVIVSPSQRTAPVVQHIVVHYFVALALRSNVDRFRFTIRHPQVQQILSQHRITIRRVFHHYANADGGEGLNRVGLQRMAKEGQWLTRLVTVDRLMDTFKHVLQQQVQASTNVAPAPNSPADGAYLGSGATGGLVANTETIGLTEFQEVICAMASFHQPNPFVPLSAKLAAFIEERVIRLLSEG